MATCFSIKWKLQPRNQRQWGSGHGGTAGCRGGWWMLPASASPQKMLPRDHLLLSMGDKLPLGTLLRIKKYILIPCRPFPRRENEVTQYKELFQTLRVCKLSWKQKHQVTKKRFWKSNSSYPSCLISANIISIPIILYNFLIKKINKIITTVKVNIFCFQKKQSASNFLISGSPRQIFVK